MHAHFADHRSTVKIMVLLVRDQTKEFIGGCGTPIERTLYGVLQVVLVKVLEDTASSVETK